MINSDLFGIQLNTLNATWIPMNFARPEIFGLYSHRHGEASEITSEMRSSLAPLCLRTSRRVIRIDNASRTGRFNLSVLHNREQKDCTPLLVSLEAYSTLADGRICLPKGGSSRWTRQVSF